VNEPISPKTSNTAVNAIPIPARTVWFMAISTGLIVANIYYAQPLLAEIAREFNLSVTQAGALAMTSQLGTAMGMLFFVPLGDTRERRLLIIVLLLGAAASLLLFAMAPTVLWLTVGSLAVGATGSVVHAIVPFAAHLAPPQQRGRVLGVVLSGLLFGILLARTASGLIGAHLGWRIAYVLAAAMMLGLAVSSRFFLPRSQPEISLRYVACSAPLPIWCGSMAAYANRPSWEHCFLRASAPSGPRWFFFCKLRRITTARVSPACLVCLVP